MNCPNYLTIETTCPHWDDHVFEEGYYGNRCKRCGLFYAYGCAPWDDLVDSTSNHEASNDRLPPLR